MRGVYTLIPAAEAPQYDEEAAVRCAEGWPEFIFHDAVAEPWNSRRAESFCDWEFYFTADDIETYLAWTRPDGLP